MNRSTLLDMIEQGTSCVRTFLVESEPLDSLAGSNDNWNDNDVVGHITGWMNYSIDKLSCIKQVRKQSEEYAHVTSLNEINAILYNKGRNKPKETIESGYIDAIGSYIKVISLFSNDEINYDTFDTGFKMDLWRYMLMDTVIHPIQHVLYQYLKKNEFRKISDAIVTTNAVFKCYSSNQDGYRLSEFAIERPEYQNKLAELEREYGDNRDVRTFVEFNRKDIA